MARQLAHSMQVFSRKRASPRQQKAEPRKDFLKKEIMRFAGITHSDFTKEANSQFLIQMSEFTDYANLGELKGYKRRILQGEENDYPIAKILKKDGEYAREIAAFLGAKYFDRFVRILAGPNNIQERETAEKALKWAFEHGDRNLSARALAGIAKGAAREVEVCKFGLMSKSYAERTGQMRFLSTKVGLESSWKIVEGINEAKENFQSKVLGASFLVGASAAGITRIFSEGLALNGSGMGGLIITFGSLIVAAGVIGQLAKTSLGELQRTLLGKLKKLPEDGHV